MGHNSLANFQIEKKIGRGQFSEVYQARYLLGNTSVALKKVQVIRIELISILLRVITCRYIDYTD